MFSQKPLADAEILSVQTGFFCEILLYILQKCMLGVPATASAVRFRYICSCGGAEMMHENEILLFSIYKSLCWCYNDTE